MSLKIYLIDHDEVYTRFRKDLVKESVAIKKHDDKTEYATIINGIHPVGIVGWQKISDGHIRYKTDYILKGFRGKGLYSRLWRFREILILEKYKVDTITAYCTRLSLPKYIKEGFVQQSVKKNGIAYVKYQNQNK